MNKIKVVLSFSGGKDSLLALYQLMKSEQYEIVALLTNLDPHDRVLMHGFTSELLEKQALSLGMSLCKVMIPKVDGKRSQYAEEMKKVLMEFQVKGVTHVAYGDIFLEEVKQFREQNLSLVGMESLFPLWGKDSLLVAEEFIALGFKAVITCVNTEFLSVDWIGKDYDGEFISHLKEKDIDPCGENGEFHTFVYGGPLFKEDVEFCFDLGRQLVCNEFCGCVAGLKID